MNILHTINGHPTYDGGPSYTVPRLADFLAEVDGLNVCLLSQSLRGEECTPSSDLVNVKLINSNALLGYKYGFGCREGVRSMIKNFQPNIIHSHGLWSPMSYWSSKFAKDFKIPLVVHPRGMLDRWALMHKGLKKYFAWIAYQKKILNQASLLIATSELEYDALRDIGLSGPIAVIPNGIDFPLIGKPEFVKKSENNNSKSVLFLSRIHPKKGLENLIKSWESLDLSDWVLNIVGSGDLEYEMQLRQQVAFLKNANSIKFLGDLRGEHKREAYLSADLFVLPTFGENFGVVVAEALSYGLPVITTNAAPWEALNQYKCGWCIDIGLDPLIATLKEATSMTDLERRRFGIRGREYVQRFEWAGIANQTHQAYSWLLGSLDRPNFIY